MSLLRQRIIFAALVAAFSAFLVFSVYLRQSLLFFIGIGLGASLAATRFGFTTGWRQLIEHQDPRGVTGQLLLLALASLVALPLLAQFSELHAALGPLSLSLLLGAFVFGASMQIADGCGSGTLYKAGLGIPFNLAIFPLFCLGSFLGSLHLHFWLGLGQLPAVSLLQQFGLTGAIAITLLLLALIALGIRVWITRGAAKNNSKFQSIGEGRDEGKDESAGAKNGLTNGVTNAAAQGTIAGQGLSAWLDRRWVKGAILLTIFASLNLVVAGQPWGIVYGMGLWAAKLGQGLGLFDASGNAFWSQPQNLQSLQDSVLLDVTSITNIGILVGALWIGMKNPPHSKTLNTSQWVAGLLAGLLMGYSSRLAFGCNVGAMLSGISTGSVHGWVWVVMAFMGSLLGVRLRRRLGF